jgi:hypothetical protein
MGNTPVKIGIRLDQDVVEAGNVLKGRVYLSVQSREQHAKGIHLVLKGEESVLIVRRNGNEHGHHSGGDHVHNHTASSSILHMDVPLTSFPTGVVPPGQYEYPFEWPLPDNIPSTMHCGKGESSCTIEYQLTAYLYNSGSLSFLPDYSSTVTVTVAALSTEQVTPVQMDLEEFNIKSCCADRGTVTMGWDADTIVAAPRGTINVGIMGKNDSSIEMKYLRSKLLETVTWSAHGHSEKLQREIASTKICATELALWKPLLYLPSRSERRRRQYDQVASHLHSEVFANRIVTQLHVYHGARDSYLGITIGVRHSLIVTAETPGACCITSPESSVLVTVQRRMPSGAVPASASAVPQPSAPIFEHERATAPMEYRHTNQEPPMAMAEVLPDDWAPHESAVVMIPANAVILQATTASRAVIPKGMMPSAPQENLLRESHQIATSLAELQTLLAASKNPTATLEQQLQNPIIVATIENLSPHEFVETLKSCSRQDADYVRNARILACTMVPHFYCRHVLACLWSLSHPVRFHVLKEMAPLASDIETQRVSVERELDPTELMEFRAALA